MSIRRGVIVSKLNWSKIEFVWRGVLVGSIVGFVISLFRLGLHYALTFVFWAYEYMNEHPWWIIPWVLLSLVVAGIVIKLVQDEPDIKGSGVHDVEGHLEGVIQLDWFSVLWRKFFGGILAIGSGLALGRQGPAIQIGGMVGLGLHQAIGGNRSQENIMLSAGAGAGLAAIFNTPVSGIMFMIEEVHHKLSTSLILTTFSATVTANYITSYFFGINPVLYFDVLEFFPMHYYGYLIGMGIILATVGKIHKELAMLLPNWLQKLPIPSYALPVLSYLMIIPVGLFLPMLLAGGSNLIISSGSGDFSVRILLALALARFVLMHASYDTGVPGGGFTPVLALGALLGGAFGTVLINQGYVDEVFLRSFVVYAMGGFLTSFTRASLTAVFLMMELTGSVTHLMPLAVVGLTTYTVSEMLNSESFYRMALLKKINQMPSALVGAIESFEVVVNRNSQLDQQPTDELDMPTGSQIVKISRHMKEFIPRTSTVLQANDILYIQADSEMIHQTMAYIEHLNTHNVKK
ncbi:hypothetical protein B8A46_07085 [Dolosigranulum pigrum]|nr:hypothetical protein B8A31_06355 [Dolosigranulum pigrum]RAN58886.1 hypothetical protein B8A46_07085 [Dolosigranulum pigrum]